MYKLHCIVLIRRRFIGPSTAMIYLAEQQPLLCGHIRVETEPRIIEMSSCLCNMHITMGQIPIVSLVDTC